MFYRIRVDESLKEKEEKYEKFEIQKDISLGTLYC